MARVCEKLFEIQETDLTVQHFSLKRKDWHFAIPGLVTGVSTEDCCYPELNLFHFLLVLHP